MDMTRTPTLWPREHGATAQLGLALGAGLLLNWPTPRALAQALLSLALFAASEPLLLLLGKRGPDARNRASGLAQRRLFSLGLAASLLALVAWRTPRPGDGLTLLPVALLAVGLFALFLRDRIHTLPGELLAALGMAAAALPVATLGLARPGQAWALAGCLAAAFLLGNLAVRGQLHFLKGRDRRYQVLSAVGGLSTLALGLILWQRGHLGLWAGLSPLPMVVLGLGLALRPPPPGPLRALGWSLTAAALASTLLALAGLR